MQSCTRSAPAAETGEDRPYRAFMIMGGKEERASAKHIIASAVELYQDLFTGKLGAHPLLNRRCFGFDAS